MNLSVIIPNYNGQELLSKNVPKIITILSLRQKLTIELIIIDDDSTDKSEEVILNLFDEYKNTPLSFIFLRNEKNLGFSSTINRAVKHAKGEIILLLNSDVIPEENFLKPLLYHFQDKTVFAVGCMDKSIERGQVVLRGRGIGEWKRGFLIHKAGKIDKSTTLWVSGGSSAFRKSIWENLHGFNSLYNPFYWEDIDLSYRAQKAGYRVIFEPKSVVTHEHEKGAIQKFYKTKEIKTIAYKNQFIFTWKNAIDLSIIFSHIFWLPYFFIKAMRHKDKAFFSGFFKAIRVFPEILKSRKIEKKQYTKSDREVMLLYSS